MIGPCTVGQMNATISNSVSPCLPDSAWPSAFSCSSLALASSTGWSSPFPSWSAPGCPCDFNQYPTQGHREALVAMRTDGDVDLSGLCWGGRLRVGDGILESEVDTLRGIDPPDPYRVLVRIPNGFEYTGPNEEAETALSTRLVSRGAIEYDLSDSHSSMAYVRHGSNIKTGAVPTVVA